MQRDPILVRVADPERDAAAIAEIYRPSVLASVATFEEVPPDATAVAARMRSVLPSMPWLVAVEGGPQAVVGYAYASRHHERIGYRWSVNISVYVREDRHGRGIGRLLYERLVDLLRRQRFVNAYAGVALPNPASEALHAAIGMERIGVYRKVGYKHGRWVDVAWFGLRLREPDDPPQEPIALDALDLADLGLADPPRPR